MFVVEKMPQYQNRNIRKSASNQTGGMSISCKSLAVSVMKLQIARKSFSFDQKKIEIVEILVFPKDEGTDVHVIIINRLSKVFIKGRKNDDEARDERALRHQKRYQKVD